MLDITTYLYKYAKLLLKTLYQSVCDFKRKFVVLSYFHKNTVLYYKYECVYL